MDIHVLRDFIVIVQERGISAAADVLRISQPALSRQMRDLESELGVTLFIRGNRGRTIELTAEGRVFYRRAREIVELADRAQAEMHRRAPVEGVVHIAAAQSHVMRVVGRAAARTRARHPDITLELQDGYGADNLERLSNGLADFGVLVQPVDMSWFDHLPLPGGDVMGVLMREGDPLEAHESITAEALDGLPLIMPRGAITRRDLSGWFVGAQRRMPHVIGTMNLLYNSACFVHAGYGYALCPDGLVDTSAGSGLTFRPLVPTLTTRLSIAWRRGRDLPVPAQVFLDELRAVIAA
ncbi:LysR family transcriptional regulator [Bifidobacterium pseudolongum]|uniref:LysR family transcriptional regulator n=1 Tax=Bifidobacterium pseudolongum TaxID=1694 RepID=UPI0010207C6B|nr:LysR family transcriptional regulator [Bifidobacterium pseudolongum]RYQ64024.1 LysR family transcriptional regulator [Bifidobacterium pseudolongum subsp. globosum]